MELGNFVGFCGYSMKGGAPCIVAWNDSWT